MLQTPIVLIAFPIIIDLLSAAIEIYGSPMNNMVKSFEIWHTYSGQSRYQKANSLAPPTRQSFKCIQLYNFGLVCPNFTNEVLLESLDHDESNINFRLTKHFGFCWKPFSGRKFWPMHRLSLDQFAQKLGDGFFYNFNFIHPLQPIKLGGVDTKQEVRPYLSNLLTNF